MNGKMCLGTCEIKEAQSMSSHVVSYSKTHYPVIKKSIKFKYGEVSSYIIYPVAGNYKLWTKYKKNYLMDLRINKSSHITEY